MRLMKWAATGALGLSLVAGAGTLLGVKTFEASKAQADASMDNSDMYNNDGDNNDGNTLVLDNGDGTGTAPTPEETDCSSDTTPLNGTAARC